MIARDRYGPYLQYCTTDRQRQIFELLIDGLPSRQVAKKLGLANGTIGHVITRIKHRAESMGFSPEKGVSVAPLDGYCYNRISTNYGEDGRIKQRWLIQTPEHEKQLEIYRQISDGMVREIPQVKPTNIPQRTNSDLLNCYVLSDVHVGMLAWKPEAGADWDLKIAEQVVYRCFEAMVQGAPDADEAVICNLGDWVHSDGLLPITPTSGHVLDQDGRFAKVIDISTRLLRRIVDLALRKHRRVRLIIAEGNHDLATSLHLRNNFKWGYENEPRLEVDDSAIPYYVHHFGRNMLGFHHGHLQKPEQMGAYFAAAFPKIWGDTMHREIHCGHRHHWHSKEYPGVVVTQHPTMAAKDAHAARHGYLSERKAICTTYRKQYGKAATNVVTPEMVM